MQKTPPSRYQNQDAFGQYLVSHCAPVLARLKSGNLLNYPCHCPKSFLPCFESYRKQLQAKGVSMTLLQISCRRILVYVYREQMLLEELNRQNAWPFLEQMGYHTRDMEDMLRTLRSKLGKGEGFPHEIGLFLGYPLQDVESFIANGGKNCVHVGQWKVYHDPESKRRLFDKYNKCTDIYCKLFADGREIAKLTVAA